MHYALLNKKVWKIIEVSEAHIRIKRKRQVIGILKTEISFIYPQLEAIKLLEKCKPHVQNMASFGDIDHLNNIDGNMLLPFAEDFSSNDTELIDFLNETIGYTDAMVKAYPQRQECTGTHLEGKNQGNKIDQIVEAFNQLHLKTNRLEIIWDDDERPSEVYLCVTAACSSNSLVKIPLNYEEEMKKLLPTFFGQTVEDGGRLLWSRIVLANFDFKKIDTFDDVKDGCKYMPFSDSTRIYWHDKIKPEYLDWVQLVIAEFNEIIRKDKQKQARLYGSINTALFSS